MTETLKELLARYRDIVIEGEGEEDASLTVEERDRSYRDWVEREAAAYGAIESLFASLEARHEREKECVNRRVGAEIREMQDRLMAESAEVNRLSFELSRLRSTQ